MSLCPNLILFILDASSSDLIRIFNSQTVCFYLDISSLYCSFLFIQSPGPLSTSFCLSLATFFFWPKHGSFSSIFSLARAFVFHLNLFSFTYSKAFVFYLHILSFTNNLCLLHILDLCPLPRAFVIKLNFLSFFLGYLSFT